MKKLFLVISVCFCFMCIFLGGCKQDVGSSYKVKIEDVEYGSLTEAVQSAKSGDEIRVYGDLCDHKNVVITKPLTIRGELSSNQVKPKFFGSITIDMKGADDVTTIENLEIVHDGVDADGINNNTRIGINLVDGGVVLKNNRICLNDSVENDKGTAGIVISRKKDSISQGNITIEGNRFDSYKKGEKLSSALMILSGGEYKKLHLNEGEIYESNSFSRSDEGNLMIFVDCEKEKYPFLVTTSTDELVHCLLNRQDGGNYTLIALSPLALNAKTASLDEKSVLRIVGNKSANFNGLTLDVYGVVSVEGEVENITFKRMGETASVQVDESVDKTKFEIV